MTTAPMPDLPTRPDLWLALFRLLHDSGIPLAEARRQADEQAGFTSTTP